MTDFRFSQGFIDGILNEALGDTTRLAEPLHALCQSPIEIQFGAAFLFLTKLMHLPAAITSSVDAKREYFELLPQAKIDPYRVDFYVAFRGVSAVVECDGRDFHYANREQIERDRARDQDLESRGLKVFRFPGQQLHAEPVSCAGDVMIWLLNTWYDRNPGGKIV